MSPSSLPRRVAITGAGGMLGSALSDSLKARGVQVQPITRKRPPPGSDAVYWQPRDGVIDAKALDGVEAVVHLAGEPIGQRWSSDVKRRIRDSRVDGTSLLAKTLAGLQHKPKVLVSASAIGIYGDRGDEVLQENSPPGNDFLANIAVAWEEATVPAAKAGIRVVNTRFGIVLSPRGGALERLLIPFRLGAGGKAGDGKQWMSWITLTDVVRAIEFVMVTESLSGPVNVAAPNPVTNEEFAKTLGHVIHRPSFATVPETMIKLVLGEMGESTVLVSQRIRSTRLLEAGFQFEHSELEAGLKAELERG